MKKVLITGVSGGIGSAVAKLFLQNDWLVYGLDVNEGEITPGLHKFWQGDVSDDALWREIAAHEQVRDGLDALVNNAAIQLCQSITQTETNEWDRLMDVNLKSVFLSIKYLTPALEGRGSAVVNIGSVHAYSTSRNIAAYAASKGGLLALTRAAALELAEKQVRVNAVMPGATDTRMLEEGLGRGHLAEDDCEAMKSALAEKTPNGRIGDAGEIAQAVLFLSDSSKSSFVTGQALVVDGGALAQLSTE